MVSRGETRERAQRFILRSAIQMLAEVKPAPQWDGSLFADVDSIRLSTHESSLLARVAEENWALVQPGLLGSVFQAMMQREKRHEQGAHYTQEKAILDYVVHPSLIQPWRKRMQQASTRPEFLEIHGALTKIRILDPACGSGNFLYVAYRALKQLEVDLFGIMCERFSGEIRAKSAIQPRQFHGIDKDPLAVELAKVTLLLEAEQTLDKPLHLRDLDDNFQCADALFCDWPKADVIIGNPPFQSKNKMQQELGADYVQRMRNRYPEVPGRADYCVYWFKRAHDELGPNATAGLVGTNTIRQNYSREGGLDHIVQHGGTITEAVSSMVWPGEAIVHVSVVNWIKGIAEGSKKLSWQEGDDRDSPWAETLLDEIPASLSAEVDVTRARILRANATAKACYQGQTHGHEGFLLSRDEATRMMAASSANGEVIFPFLIGEDLLNNIDGKRSRWVIDFHPRDQVDARNYELPFRRLQERVLPDRELAAREEKARNAGLNKKGNRHHAHFLKRWWSLSYPRGELLQMLGGITRFIACSRVTKRPIFEFVSSRIRPNDALVAFPLEDDYSFGILQSGIHSAWFKARCSTLKGDWRYTSNTVFDSFPWPQDPSPQQCADIAMAAVALRAMRRDFAVKHGMTLRALYLSMEDSAKHPLKEAHADLDVAVRVGYGLNARQDPLGFLLELNVECAAREAKAESITGPGLPEGIAGANFVTRDAIQPPEI